MNTLAEQECIFSDDGICNYCNGTINKQGYFIHETGCVYEDGEYGSEIEENEREDQEESETEADKQVEEFKLKLEKIWELSNGKKRKMKPNISTDWISKLKESLKSGSTTECSSNERVEKQTNISDQKARNGQKKIR